MSAPAALPPSKVEKYSSWSTPMPHLPWVVASTTPPEPVGPPAPKITSAPSPMNWEASEAPLSGVLNASL